MPKLHLFRYKGALLLSLVLFAAGLVLGCLNAGILQSVVAGEVDKLREVSGGLAASEHPELQFFIFIFLNNVIKSVLVIWLGAFLGVLPVLFLLLNGLALGFVVSASGAAGADLGELIVKGLLPHGIIEIPALLLACGYGLKFGGMVWAGLFKPRRKGESGKRKREWASFLNSAWSATLWVVILLVIAALIESTVTYHLVRN
ncbi:stage II sporulation protein M [Paenibacillus physcomitrellae]|uniref:Sporulation protein n=1 Tax=Paenibacillus physcomitrellae TaxID=1619311 RepID=A0ABQ1GWU1_9BACL|nr:stage II sporulation protein M [Paenibacillus physcomitrellae]GGA51874.1 sporulation protein [Paenibacillus physcomitrellae]